MGPLHAIEHRRRHRGGPWSSPVGDPGVGDDRQDGAMAHEAAADRDDDGGGDADRGMSQAPTRVVIVGADAAGMSAAHQALRTARRTGRELEVTVLDKGTHTSYSACGIPYWMAGDVDSGEDLVARSAEKHRESGIDLRMETEVVAADLGARTVTTGAGEEIAFDELVVATGAPATMPDWALRPDGTTYDGVGAVSYTHLTLPTKRIV